MLTAKLRKPGDRLIPGSSQETDHSTMNTSRKDLNWEAVDRLDWHLWILSIFLICVLGLSLLTFMFPTVFWVGKAPEASLPQRAFVGFCVLLALVLVYLIQRQATVRQLKRQLFAAQAAVAAVERGAAIQAVAGLPDTEQFRDTLAMVYRRCSSSGAHLAIAVFAAPTATSETLGRMVYSMRPMLRRGESLYRISDKAVGVILPGMQLNDATSFAAQVEEVSGFPKGNLEFAITAYPEESESLAELEMRLRGCPENRSPKVWSQSSAVSQRGEAAPVVQMGV